MRPLPSCWMVFLGQLCLRRATMLIRMGRLRILLIVINPPGDDTNLELGRLRETMTITLPGLRDILVILEPTLGLQAEVIIVMI